MTMNLILGVTIACVAEEIVILAGIARCKTANKDVQEQAREDAEQMEYLHQYSPFYSESIHIKATVCGRGSQGDIMRVISGHLNACQRLVQTLPGDHENTYILVFEDIQ